MSQTKEMEIWKEFKALCELRGLECRTEEIFLRCLKGGMNYDDAYSGVTKALYFECTSQYRNKS